MQAALFVGIFLTASVAKVAVAELSGYSKFERLLMPGGFFLQPIARQILRRARVQHFRRRSRQTASACQSGEDVALRWRTWRRW